MSESTQDERLLSLEGAVREIGRATERVAVGQQNLFEKVEEGFESMAKAHTDLAARQASFDNRLKPFEEREAAWSRRRDVIKKAAIPAVAATAGVFGAKFGNQLLIWLGALFGK